MSVLLKVEGRPQVSNFDMSYYSDEHDVPAIWIGNQIVALGDGYHNWPPGKDDPHLRWQLDPNKTYRVTIEELN